MSTNVIVGQSRFVSRRWTHAAVESIKTANHCGTGSYSIQKGATDAIGSMALTLTNLIVGSAIRIEVQSTGALVELRTAASATEVFTVSVYEAGSASNNLRVKIRKGSSAPLYKPLETLVTAAVGSQSVYIAQIPD